MIRATHLWLADCGAGWGNNDAGCGLKQPFLARSGQEVCSGFALATCDLLLQLGLHCYGCCGCPVVAWLRHDVCVRAICAIVLCW